MTSFPGNPARGLPTVTGVVLLSDAETGELRALFDAAAVTALRTGAAAVLAAETLGRDDAQTAAVIGAGVNGRAAARTFLARGRDVLLWDLDQARAEAAATELGARVAGSREEALSADLLVTMTPGHDVLLAEGSLQPGQHVSLMGADGPGKAEIAVAELARARVFCDDWEQASHNGELAHAVEAGALARDDVTQLGDVLAGQGRGPALDRRDHRLRLDGAGDSGPGDRARGNGARRRARALVDRSLERGRREARRRCRRRSSGPFGGGCQGGTPQTQPGSTVSPSYRGTTWT